ncbi:hypothetical protein BC937DRAFT_91389 [Endogone sp. FLAS-F59071]|nr:hypothetical protein BC937DRAFT_91389 [Endogone sp. FLAS-F59071]|eukprot:RUS16295.1 hypothetical protein BC937DRAFT_91389 [Endogone sp. FLAS-F59071]
MFTNSSAIEGFIWFCCYQDPCSFQQHQDSPNAARRSSIGSTVSISDVVAQPTKAAAKTTTETAKTGAKQEKAAPVPSPSVSLQSNGKTDNVCIFCA